MKLTSYGQQRVDLVDHVFGIGASEDVPVAGDWNGNGVRSIGKFNEVCGTSMSTAMENSISRTP